MIPAPLRLVALLAAVATAAKGEQRVAAGSTQDGRRSRDSSGVQIIEFDRLDTSRASLRIAQPPILVIGRRSGRPADEHRYPLNATRVDDETIVLNNGRGAPIGVFDNRGTSRRSLPGAYYSACALQGDTLLALRSLTQLQVLRSNGRVADSTSVPNLARPLCGGDGFSFLSSSTPFEFATRTATRQQPSNDIRRTQVRLQRVQRGSGVFVLIDIGLFPDAEMYQQLSVPNGPGNSRGFTSHWIERPFTRKASVAVEGDRVHIGDGGNWEIRTLNRDGRVTRLLRVLAPADSVTPALRSAHADETFAASQGITRQEHDDRRRVRESNIWPLTIPHFIELKLDRVQRRLWVRRYPRPGERSQTWHVFSADARSLGSLTFPPDFAISEVGGDYVIGNTLIENGAAPATDAREYEVTMYRLQSGD